MYQARTNLANMPNFRLDKTADRFARIARGTRKEKTKKRSKKMKYYTMTGILISTERRNCSIYGNPAWNLTIEYDGEYITGKTASDAQCGYSVSNHKIGDQITIKGHFTRVGNLIIDSIKD
jgi:hypothetical protein